MLALLLMFSFCAIMLIAALTDLLTMTISNRLTLGLALIFILCAFFTGIGLQDYLWHLTAGAVVLAAGFILFILGCMGGGDAKLLGASALWFGFSPSLGEYLLNSALIGGILTLIILLLRSFLSADSITKPEFLRKLLHKQTGIPYGIALGLAGLTAFPHSVIGLWVTANLPFNEWFSDILL